MLTPTNPPQWNNTGDIHIHISAWLFQPNTMDDVSQIFYLLGSLRPNGLENLYDTLTCILGQLSGIGVYDDTHYSHPTKSKHTIIYIFEVNTYSVGLF